MPVPEIGGKAVINNEIRGPNYLALLVPCWLPTVLYTLPTSHVTLLYN